MPIIMDIPSLGGGGDDWTCSVVNVGMTGGGNYYNYSGALDTTENKYPCYYSVGGFRGDNSATYYVQGSNDASNWTNLRSVTPSANRHSWMNGSYNTYRYYRVYFYTDRKTVINGCVGMLACAMPPQT